MGILDTFDLYRRGEGGKIFISITNYGMTFSKSCVEKLNYPEFVHVFFEQEGKRMAIAPCTEDSEARGFVRDQSAPRAGFVRWNDRKLIQHAVSLANIELGKRGVRIYGQYIADDNVLVFDLKVYTPIGKQNETQDFLE